MQATEFVNSKLGKIFVQKIFSVSGIDLPIIVHRLFATVHRLLLDKPFTDYLLPLTDYRSPIIYYRLPITIHRQSTAVHRFTIDNQLLNTQCHTPPVFLYRLPAILPCRLLTR